MSAPQTDIEKQERHHWAPLLGMALAALFGVGLILLWLFHEVDDAPDTGPPATQAAPDAGTLPATGTIEPPREPATPQN